MSLFYSLLTRLHIVQANGAHWLIVSRLFAKMINWHSYIILLPIFYFLIKGNSPGKAILDIKTIRLDGKPLGFWFNVWRNICAGLLYLFPLLVVPFIEVENVAFFYLFALLLYMYWALLFNDGVFIHDKLTKTRVVRISKGNA